MNNFEVQILQPSGTILEIETINGDNSSNIEIIQSGNPILQITNDAILLPAEFNTLVNAQISSFISGGSGIILDTSPTGLTINSSIISGSGINITHNSGSYEISATNNIDNEQIQDIIANLLTGNNGIVIDYNDNTNQLIISTSGLQPSGVYPSGVHYHTSSDITDFNSAVSGLIPPSNFTSLSGISGILVTNSGTDYYVSLLDPSIQLQDITDLSNNARTLLLTPSSSNLSNLISDETGSGLLVFNNSPALSGAPTAPTAPSGTNSTQIANTEFVRTEISNLVNSAPSTLDTLNELASALGNDPNFATTVASGLGQKANLSGATFTGLISGPSGNFSILQQSGINVSISGHTHTYSDITNFASGIEASVSTLLMGGNNININYDNLNDTLTISATGLQPSGNYSVVGHTHTSSEITDFNSSVSGLLPVTNILGGTNISVVPSGSSYTVSVSGQLGLTAEEVDDRVASLLVAGSGIRLSYNDSSNTLTISTSGLQPSGNYSLVGHSHISSDITDFSSSVSGLLPVKDVSAGDNISVSSLSGVYTVSATGLQPSGDYSVVGHSHTSSDITNFNTSVSGLLPTVSGSGFVVTSFDNNVYNVSVTGVQPSGDYSVVGHTHSSSDITDFSSSVSGLLPTISNSGDNRLLTSTGTSTGINAESNITFDGSGLNTVSSSGFIISSLGTPPDLTSQVYGQLPPPHFLGPATRISLVQENYARGPTLELRYAGPSVSDDETSYGSGAPRLILAKSKGSYISPNPLEGTEAIGVIRADASPSLVESSTGTRTRTSGRIIFIADGIMEGTNVYQPSRLQLEVSSGSGVIDKQLTIWSDGRITTNCSLSVDNGVAAPTPIFTIGTATGNTAISFGVDRQIQKLTLNGTSVNFTEGTGWDVADRSIDVVLEITVSSTTSVAFDSNFITDWYSSLPSFVPGKYLILLRSMGTGVVQGHYLGNKIN